MLGTYTDVRNKGEGVGLLVKVSRSFLQIKTQQAEPDRLSGELDTQTIAESVCLTMVGIELPIVFEPEAHWLWSLGAGLGQP